MDDIDLPAPCELNHYPS